MNALMNLITPLNSSSSPFFVSIITNISENENVNTKNVNKNGNSSNITAINISANTQKDSSYL